VIGLLPWEKWLPPIVFGPLMFVGSLYLIFTVPQMAWCHYVLLSCAALFGAYATYAWLKRRENVFK
jgi:hypothetical protein